jgi:hypothetical protein
VRAPPRAATGLAKIRLAIFRCRKVRRRDTRLGRIVAGNRTICRAAVGVNKPTRNSSFALVPTARSAPAAGTPNSCGDTSRLKSAIREAVENFDAFTPDNDPYGERDFGAFEHNGDRIFWKIAAPWPLPAAAKMAPSPRATNKVLLFAPGPSPSRARGSLRVGP